MSLLARLFLKKRPEAGSRRTDGTVVSVKETHAQALDRLLKDVEDPDYGVRLRAAKALGEMRDPRSVSALASLLDRAGTARMFEVAFLALEKIGTPEAIRAMEDRKSERAKWQEAAATTPSLLKPVTFANKDRVRPKYALEVTSVFDPGMGLMVAGWLSGAPPRPGDRVRVGGDPKSPVATIRDVTSLSDSLREAASMGASVTILTDSGASSGSNKYSFVLEGLSAQNVRKGDIIEAV